MWKELLRNKDWLRTLVCNWITNQVVYESLLSRPCTACRTCLVCSTRHRTPSPCPPALGHSRPRRSRSSSRCDSCWTCFCQSASSRRARWGRRTASPSCHTPPWSPCTWPWRWGTCRRPWGSWPTLKCSILRPAVVSAMFWTNKVFLCPLFPNSKSFAVKMFWQKVKMAIKSESLTWYGARLGHWTSVSQVALPSKHLKSQDASSQRT